MMRILTAGFVLISVLLSGCGNPQPKTADAQTIPDSTKVEIVETYHPNGVIEKRGKLVEGERHGLWTSYYPNGNLWSEMNYVRGKKNGVATTYFDNGKMRYSGKFDNDRKSDIWYFYDSTGTVVKKIDYSKLPAETKNNYPQSK